MDSYPTNPETLGEQARHMGEDAASRVQDAAGKVRAAATHAVRSVADAAGAGRQAAAERLSSTADYVRTHDFQRVTQDLEGVVRNNPGPALLVAAAFGFLLGRAMSRD